MTMEEQKDLWSPLYLGLMVSLLAIVLESSASGPKELLPTPFLQRASKGPPAHEQHPPGSQQLAGQSFTCFFPVPLNQACAVTVCLLLLPGLQPVLCRQGQLSLLRQWLRTTFSWSIHDSVPSTLHHA